MSDRNLYGRAVGLDERGRFATFGKAVDAVLVQLTTERNSFFDLVSDKWDDLFPGLRAKPGRFEDGKIVIYVKSAPMLYAVRQKLGFIKSRLLSLPGAPGKLTLRLEIHY